MLQTALTAKRPTKTNRNAVLKDYGHIPASRIESYGRSLLAAIKRNLGNAEFFTREDLLQIAFPHVSTITRHSHVCQVVHFLADRGDVVLMNRTDICLAGDQQKRYSPTPLSQTYYMTICGVVTRIEARSRTTVMDIVALWTTDQHLTINNKRVAVRGAIARLVRDEFLKKINDFEFIVQKQKH